MSLKELKQIEDTLLKEQAKLKGSQKARKEFLIKTGLMTPKGNFKRKFKALG
jgi:hypothetical protein